MMDTSPSLEIRARENSPSDQLDREIERRNAHTEQRREVKTSFLFASPPPRASYRKLRPRDKLSLQIQRVNNSARPTPEFDVLETDNIRMKSARILSSILSRRSRSSMKNFIVDRNGPYEKQEPNCEQRVSSDNFKGLQEAIATLRLSQNGKTKAGRGGRIMLQNGSCWEASGDRDHGYKFILEGNDSEQRAVQWLLCRGEKENDSGGIASVGSNTNENRSFKFSISTQTRSPCPGHLTASMTTRRIDITNHHPKETAKGSRMDPEAAHLGDLGDGEDAGDKESRESDVNLVGEDFCMLALVTGIWVAVCEGRSE